MRRGLFLVGKLDLTGMTAAAILAKSAAGSERVLALLAALGTLVGKEQETDAITMGSVTVAVENLP